MKGVLVVITMLIIAGLMTAWTYNEAEKKVVVLKATFRMGGVTYEGYEMQGNTLVFKFRRTGDFFTQAIVEKEVKAEVDEFPAKVVMEVDTNGNVKRYNAELVSDDGNEKIYKASEL